MYVYPQCSYIYTKTYCLSKKTSSLIAEMQKLEVKLDIHCERAKMKAIKAISGFTGIDSISADLKEGKLTVIGDVDPVLVVRKLRKKWHTDILTVGPAKPPEKPKGKEPEVKICSSFYPYMPPPYVVYSIEENPNACVIC